MIGYAEPRDGTWQIDARSQAPRRGWWDIPGTTDPGQDGYHDTSSDDADPGQRIVW
jgi:hypothetical protein